MQLDAFIQPCLSRKGFALILSVEFCTEDASQPGACHSHFLVVQIFAGLYQTWDWGEERIASYW